MVQAWNEVNFFRIVIFSLIMLIITGLIMNRFVVGGEDSALLMELPLYHLPNPRIIGLVTWQNTMAFIKRAGTIILAVSLIIWILATVPHGDINTSTLSHIGKFLPDDHPARFIAMFVDNLDEAEWRNIPNLRFDYGHYWSATIMHPSVYDVALHWEEVVVKRTVRRQRNNTLNINTTNDTT